jgi:parvulin-like peptidyl-prolyl isomerase
MLREPLMHFMLGGAALFALYSWTGGSAEPDSDRIVVSEGRVENLASTFEKTWLRPPTERELAALIDEYVREEIFYREALALGLDRDDLIIRRRLRQKMEFLGEDIVELAKPDESELRVWFDARSEKFEIPEKITFRQIFLSTERGDAAVEERAAALLKTLRSEPDAAAEPAGDPTLLPPGQQSVTLEQVARVFGPEFALALERIAAKRWTGPVRSSYGAHLVYVVRREPPELPEFDAVRKQVEREWANDRRETVNEEFYRTFRERYDVEIRMPGGRTQ